MNIIASLHNVPSTYIHKALLAYERWLENNHILLELHILLRKNGIYCLNFLVIVWLVE